MSGWIRASATAATSALVLGAVVATLAPGPTATAATTARTVFADGFESGDLSAWTNGSGLSVEQGLAVEGTRAARATMSGSGAYAYRTLDETLPEVAVSVAVDPLTAPTGSAVNFLKVRTASGSAIAEVYLTSSGAIGVRNDVVGRSTNSPVVLTTGAWHTVDLHVVVDGASSTATVDVDGTRVLDLTTDLGTTDVGRVQVGENVPGRTADLVYDRVAVTVPDTTPPPDPGLFSDGFESGDLTAWSGGSGLVVQQAVVAEGAWAARGTMDGGGAYAYRTLDAAVGEVVASVRVRVESFTGSVAVNFLKLRTASGTALAEAYVTPAGLLGARNDVVGSATNSTAAVSDGQWHTVSLRAVVGVAGALEVDLDGTTVLDLTADLGTTDIGRVQVGENVPGRTADLVYDTVSVAAPDTAPPPPPPPALFSDGFETGDLSAWSGGSGLVVQQDLVADGSWAARAAMTGSGAYAYRSLGTDLADVTLSTKVRLVSFSGSVAVNFLKVRTASGTALAEVYVTPAGLLGVRNDVAGVATNSTTTLAPGGWHEVTLHAVVGASGSLEVSLDGSSVLDLAADLGTTPVGRVQVGENVPGRTADLAYDTVVVDGSTTPSGADPVLLAAGDIACDPLSSSFNGGDGTATACRQKAVSDLVLTQSGVSAVAALGDIQYHCGGYDAFMAAYDPTWGRFKSITRPAVGNHEYIATSTGPATDCDPTGTADGYFRYFGAAAGQKGQGYYSYDLGAWHVVVLNSNCSDAGGCGTGSPQETWLRADLAAHPTQCTLAYWHIPLWSSGGRAANNTRTFVADLVAAGAEVVLTGHDHTYERFAPMDSTGAASPTGVRQFVVGTGGANHTTFPTTAPNSEVRNADTFGVLRLTLHADSYDWQFLPEAGATFTDAGSQACH